MTTLPLTTQDKEVLAAAQKTQREATEFTVSTQSKIVETAKELLSMDQVDAREWDELSESEQTGWLNAAWRIMEFSHASHTKLGVALAIISNYNMRDEIERHETEDGYWAEDAEFFSRFD